MSDRIDTTFAEEFVLSSEGGSCGRFFGESIEDVVRQITEYLIGKASCGYTAQRPEGGFPIIRVYPDGVRTVVLKCGSEHPFNQCDL